MAKCFAVRDQKLEIARIGLIGMRIVNFINDAVAQREPKPATGVIRCAQPFLGAGCPARLDSRRAKGQCIVGCSHCSKIRDEVSASKAGTTRMRRAFPLPTTKERGEGQGEGFLVSSIDSATLRLMNPTANARRPRRKQTSEEKQLWRALRAGRFAGSKFRR